MNRPFPAAFADFAPATQAWALDKRSARMAKRVGSKFEDIQSFFDEVQPRLEQMIAYLNVYDPHNLPEEAKSVLWLSLALIECAKCVELWRTPDIEALHPDRLRTYYECNPTAPG